MGNNLFFSLACDTDPDINPPFRICKSDGADHPSIWRGITRGIEGFRQRLKSTSFLSKHAALPVTWLLRADRQIYEIYGTPSYCFQHFEKIWEQEIHVGSEIGWHPHLYRWSTTMNQWRPYLGYDDDIQILRECLHALRQCVDVQAVRTGWDYHSNTLMHFFDHENMVADASALPRCTQTGLSFYDWRTTPRTPYFPSQLDYRQGGHSPNESLNIIEMPVLLRKLQPSAHLARYALRKLRVARPQAHHRHLMDWESAKWQGVMITGPQKAFREAVQQTCAAYPQKDHIFLTTYFHTDELLSEAMQERLVHNLEHLWRFAERQGLDLVPVTLSTAASFAKKQYQFQPTTV